MATMGLSLVVTLLAFICQTIAVFLPGWSTFKSGTDEVQVGVWYKCVNWTGCQTTIKDLTSALPGTKLDTNLVILVASETTGFVLLFISTSMLSFIVCCSSSAYSNLVNVTIRVIIGLNMSAAWSIIIGVLMIDLHYFKNIYGYGVVLAIVASLLSLVTTILACCENKSYKSRRPMITGYIDPPSDMYASNTISKHHPDYYPSNHMPYPNYHHGAPYYG